MKQSAQGSAQTGATAEPDSAPGAESAPGRIPEPAGDRTAGPGGEPRTGGETRPAMPGLTPSAQHGPHVRLRVPVQPTAADMNRVPEPGAGAGREAGRSPAQTPGQTPGQASAPGPLPGFAQGQLPGSMPGFTPGSVQGPLPGFTPGSVQGPLPGSARGSVQGPPPGPVPGVTPGSVQGPPPGSAQASAARSARRHEQRREQSHAQGQAPGQAPGHAPGQAPGREEGRAPGREEGRGAGHAPSPLAGVPQSSARTPASAARGEHTHSEPPAPAHRPVVQRSSVRGQILDALRTALAAGNLTPGEVYSAPALGERFGVSATPVREAMQQLALEGAVEVVPNRGFRVVQRGAREIAELAEIRALIEVPVLLRLARTVPAERWAELRPAAEETIRAAASGCPAAYGESDRAFHRAVLALSGNEQLVRLAEDLHRRAQWPLTNAPARHPRTDLPADASEHSALLDALIARDLDAVRYVLGEHFAATT